MNKSKQTYASRVEIGFPKDRREWRSLPASFGEQRLAIGGHPVMEDWETGYMRRLAEVAGSKCGRVLEVGFGMGISARFLQDLGVEEHVVIEANRDVYGRLLAFAREAPGRVLPMSGFWEDIAPCFPDGSFSSILFDTYPLSEEEIHRNHFPFFREAYRLLKPGGVLTYYSDEAEGFSPEHRLALELAGFTDIRGEACEVEPPKDCVYWRERTLIVPIVFK